MWVLPPEWMPLPVCDLFFVEVTHARTHTQPHTHKHTSSTLITYNITYNHERTHTHAQAHTTTHNKQPNIHNGPSIKLRRAALWLSCMIPPITRGQGFYQLSWTKLLWAHHRHCCHCCHACDVQMLSRLGARDDGLYLYRGILHPDVPDLGFVGLVGAQLD